jgi:NtrC-family two-component system response regulator AlgB
MNLDVLLVDDEKNIRATLRMCLEGFGCRVTEAQSAKQATDASAGHSFDLAFLDLRLGDASGLDLIPVLLATHPALDIVMITAYATIDTAVEAISRGARDYVPKPFTPAQIRQIVERLRARRKLEREVSELKSRLNEASPAIDLETCSPKMRSVLELLGRAAGHDVPLLIKGENGTGKSVLARHVHEQSGRKGRPFVVINCPTLSDELLASELFGHAKGAFTGAVRDQPGRVEAAEGGTLFLDEIGELSSGLQAKLLRFLQDKEFERVGESETRRADVRILAATNRDLDKDVKEGHFREDLLYRLNTLELSVPPLRERPEDIVPLARRFLAFFAGATKRPPQLSQEFEETLRGYGWPGNVRELRNAIERATILATGEILGTGDLPARVTEGWGVEPAIGESCTLEALERMHIQRVLARASTAEEAARILGIDASTLWRKRKKFEPG